MVVYEINIARTTATEKICQKIISIWYGLTVFFYIGLDTSYIVDLFTFVSLIVIFQNVELLSFNLEYMF